MKSKVTEDKIKRIGCHFTEKFLGLENDHDRGG